VLEGQSDWLLIVFLLIAGLLEWRKNLRQARYYKARESWYGCFWLKWHKSSGVGFGLLEYTSDLNYLH